MKNYFRIGVKKVTLLLLLINFFLSLIIFFIFSLENIFPTLYDYIAVEDLRKLEENAPCQLAIQLVFFVG